MQIIKGLSEKFDFINPVVTIGNFDGVHIGHQKILQRVIKISKQFGGTPVAITFEPHPVRVLTPERDLKMLMTLDDKIKLLSQFGLKALIIIPFDRQFSLTEPETFIKDILVDKIGVKWLIVGHNFSFGKRKKGNTNLLRHKAKKYSFGFSVVRYAMERGYIVSSSRIRNLIEKGKVFEASEMLDRAYHVRGVVIKGTGRGAAVLNIPTANIKPVNEILPKEGVYAVRVSFANSETGLQSSEVISNSSQFIIPPNVFEGAANIGKNPTFGDIENVILEVHILNFSQNLLGKELLIHFVDRIRDERKFSSVVELQKHIVADINLAKKILNRKKPRLFLSDLYSLQYKSISAFSQV